MDDLVLAVAADLEESLLRLLMRQEAPAKRSAIGVEAHLEDTVLAAKGDRLEAVLVVGELRHRRHLNGKLRTNGIGCGVSTEEPTFFQVKYISPGRRNK
jgi:hypothetical protein